MRDVLYVFEDKEVKVVKTGKDENQTCKMSVATVKLKQKLKLKV